MSLNIAAAKSFNDFLTPIQNNILKALQRDGPATRGALVDELKVPRTTIYDNLLKLQQKRMIEKFSRNSGKRGRPIVFWKLII